MNQEQFADTIMIAVSKMNRQQLDDFVAMLKEQGLEDTVATVQIHWHYINNTLGFKDMVIDEIYETVKGQL